MFIIHTNKKRTDFIKVSRSIQISLLEMKTEKL